MFALLSLVGVVCLWLTGIQLVNVTGLVSFCCVGVYILIAAGGLVMLVGFFGCCGAVRESQCLLGSVSHCCFVLDLYSISVHFLFITFSFFYLSCPALLLPLLLPFLSFYISFYSPIWFFPAFQVLPALPSFFIFLLLHFYLFFFPNFLILILILIFPSLSLLPLLCSIPCSSFHFSP